MPPVLALVIANIIWGAAVPIFKYAIADIPSFILLTIRFGGAGLLFLPFILKYPFKKISARYWIEIIMGSLFSISLSVGLLFLGLQRAPSINASVIGASEPLLLFLMGISVLHESTTHSKKVFIGMMLSLFGVLVIIFSPLFLDHGMMEAGAIEGNLFYIASRFCAVIGAIIMKKALKNVDPMVITTLSFLISGVSFIPFALIDLHTWSFAQLSMKGWVGIIYGMLLSSAAGYYLYYYGLAKIRAQEVGIFSYLDPVVTVLVAIPLLAEYPNAYFLFGTLLVFAGIYISEGKFSLHHKHVIRRELSETDFHKTVKKKKIIKSKSHRK
jgi:drug/metabolite transporter (DMT)-like permease